ncbi:glycerophosphodiester phosphodiesterase [Sphingomonas cavernae]|uniref:glycerophosphodiester phosphodiesterase n=1 Tax=Sphingomonas cavernae TaxID=2320861 RepID=A0A418W7N1_9SPHN|nr:glycerophosphodiester phosphodiesterase [Sphingomonas cavernae]RJF86008.1 glycerophosphodiester phosphodiesterase [Sphingomonas cavernae]
MPVSTEPAARPIVIAHRGASGERPEHTLASYTRAIELGADYIEPDLVMTRDGVLVARHENEISGTTDVADRPKFKARKTVKTIDGERVTGWFTEDFTLAELKTLRARERLPQLRPQNTAYDGQFEIPTFQEIIDLVRTREAVTGRRIGIYPETKHPGYFQGLGLAMEAPLVAMLESNGYRTADDPVFIQSFEAANLRVLRGLTKLRLIQLLGSEPQFAAMATAEGLKAVAAYADGVGAAKALIVPVSKLGRRGTPTRFVADAHAAGLKVHAWTFRAENYFLPADMRRGINPRAHGDLAAEIRLFVDLGVDGLFSDNPGEALAALE